MRTLNVLETGVFAIIVAIVLFLIEFVAFGLIAESVPPSQYNPTIGVDSLSIFLIIDIIIALILVFGINLIIGRIIKEKEE